MMTLLKNITLTAQNQKYKHLNDSNQYYYPSYAVEGFGISFISTSCILALFIHVSEP
jgi:hypothetical protein